MPIGASPETSHFYFGTEDVVEVYHRHLDKITPFCNLDPRPGYYSPKTDFSWIGGSYLTMILSISNTERRESQNLITEGKIKILLQWVDTIIEPKQS